MLKRTCGILCSDTSIFKVLLCHINNFSYFTLINTWWREFDFSSYLFKFLYVRPQYIRSTMTMGLCFFMQNFCVFRIISILFREIFVLFFREIFIFIFSRNFRIIFGKLIKFSHFSRANEMQNFRETIFSLLRLPGFPRTYIFYRYPCRVVLQA